MSCIDTPTAALHSTARNVIPCGPISEAVCNISVEKDQEYANKFHGNMISIHIPAIVNDKDRIINPYSFLQFIKCTIEDAIPKNNDKIAGIIVMANGTKGQKIRL
ncbi:oxidoreductase domain-containing protein [Ehrlichia ruminantium]|nr:oxidoreductase domain-containing protein [Ehrlichia ruminantium]